MRLHNSDLFSCKFISDFTIKIARYKLRIERCEFAMLREKIIVTYKLATAKKKKVRLKIIQN